MTCDSSIYYAITSLLYAALWKSPLVLKGLREIRTVYVATFLISSKETYS